MTGRQTVVNTIYFVRSPRLRGTLMLVYCYRNIQTGDGIENVNNSSKGANMSAPWVVHKFGGTSLADAECYRNVATIMRAQEGERKAVIVSAMHKVTDALIELVDLAKARDEAYLARADALKARHVEAVEALFPPKSRQHFFD